MWCNHYTYRLRLFMPAAGSAAVAVAPGARPFLWCKGHVMVVTFHYRSLCSLFSAFGTLQLVTLVFALRAHNYCRSKLLVQLPPPKGDAIGECEGKAPEGPAPLTAAQRI